METGLPHNVEAEAATLGSIQIGGIEALLEVVDLLQPSDFYDHRHRAIYGAMLDVWKRREPLDPLNMLDALVRAGTLDAVGGSSYMTGLVHAVPTWLGIKSYAAKVEGAARRRRIIAAAQQMASDAYREADADEAQALAESHLRTALQHSGREEGTDIADAVAAFMEEIDQTLEKGTEPGITTGFRDLDNHLSGFLPAELMYLCARPGSFKSTIAGAIALHVARTYGRVEWVSLEMSHIQLAKRIITSWARINGRVIRAAFRRPDGAVDIDAYERVCAAVEDLKKLKGRLRLYDQPLTMERLRRHAMRAVYQHGCKLLIVDYLGLMDGDSPRDTEYQRVTKVSKALKQLALELKLPILCLVQMNRESEKRADKRPTLSDMRDCLVGSTRLVDADTGRRIPIAEVKSGMRVLGLDKHQQIDAATVADVWPTGVKQVFTVTTRTGHRITATANHPLYTPSGWCKVGELRPGDLIASAFRLPQHGAELPERADKCRLLGYMVGDGTYQKHREVGFISADDRTLDDVCEVVLREFPTLRVRERRLRHKRARQVAFSATYENGYGKPYGNPLREWLRGIGIFGQCDADKRIPHWVFEAGTVGAAHFLAGYLASDGCVKHRIRTDGDSEWAVHFDTISRALADDVVALLARLGIVARIGKGYQSPVATCLLYRVYIGGDSHNLHRFASMVPVRGKKADLLAQLREETQGSANGLGGKTGSLMGLPTLVSEMIAAKSRTAGLHWTKTWRHQDKRLSREECARWAKRLSDQDLHDWAYSDVLWDPIMTIDEAGEAETYDIAIPDRYNFLADGIVAHNSGGLEQDPDWVIGIHYEARYNEKLASLDQRFRQFVELRVLKAREGVANITIPLRIEAEYTRPLDWPEEWAWMPYLSNSNDNGGD